MGRQVASDRTQAMSELNLFVQWKGTYICCDFTCSCGNYQHIDGYHFGYLKCDDGDCGKLWKMEWIIPEILTEVDPETREALEASDE